MCDLSRRLCGPPPAVEPFRLYSGAATVVSVFLLEEQLWTSYLWSKHFYCLRCNTVVHIPDMTISRLRSYGVLMFAALQHLFK